MQASTAQPKSNGQAAGRASVVFFRCASARNPVTATDLSGRGISIQEVLLPCAGRIQPEHLLKAVEKGADLVCVVTCGDGECIYLEGGLRLARRAQFVRGLLNELGVGQRLLVLQTDDASQPETIIANIQAAIDKAGLNPLRPGGVQGAEQ